MEFNLNKKMPLYKSVVQSIIENIKKGILKTDDKLPSINELQSSLNVSRDTVIKSLYELRELGYIVSVPGKGFYILTNDVKHKYHILLIMDTMRPYKEVFYKSFVDSIGERALVDVHFHYHNLKLFKRLIEDNAGNYTHYAIMPFFDNDISDIIKNIPQEKIILVDGDLPRENNYTSIVQPFYHQTYSSLVKALPDLRKYNSFKISIHREFQFTPNSIIKGYVDFCNDYGFKYEICDPLNDEDIVKGAAYLVVSDVCMVRVMEKAYSNNWELGKDIGLIGFDDTPIRKILNRGVSVISTDFEKLGKNLCDIIINNRKEKIENEFYFAQRSTL
ncbi:MAG: GntR family transcriptional regulator [Bacteroidales bacterium]|nr:GntR family transcriptional regulator [Bacteroidales bacterium]